MINFDNLGNGRMKKARAEKKLTQEQLAEIVGITPSHMSCIERAKAMPSLDAFIAICNVLEVSADAMLADYVRRSDSDKYIKSIIIGKLDQCSGKNASDSRKDHRCDDRRGKVGDKRAPNMGALFYYRCVSIKACNLLYASVPFDLSNAGSSAGRTISGDSNNTIHIVYRWYPK